MADVITEIAEAAVLPSNIGDKEIPLLIYPDRSQIHLMPWSSGEGYQRPHKELSDWLKAWLEFHSKQEHYDSSKT